MDNNIKVKFTHVHITLSNDTIMERQEDYTWTITGSVYPKHLKFLHQLNDMIRECDS